MEIFFISLTILCILNIGFIWWVLLKIDLKVSSIQAEVMTLYHLFAALRGKTDKIVDDITKGKLGTGIHVTDTNKRGADDR